MKVDKAIQILSESANMGIVMQGQQNTDALRLGVEALEVIQTYRETYVHIPFDYLPSETKGKESLSA